MENYKKLIVSSWNNSTGNINSNKEIMNWINKVKSTTSVNVLECNLEKSSYWFYEKNIIKNLNNSFFSICGIQRVRDNHIIEEQPIIIQPEIGYLGFLCKVIKGELNFLVQAKIEPGNINHVQLSPTIQATKSNFTQKHGGKIPKYFDFFNNTSNLTVLYDQIQSEQGSKFFKKRNRNIVILLNNELVEESNNFKWMTLGQIKLFMNYNNIVNMDTRTVISGLSSVVIDYYDENLQINNHLFTNSFNSKGYYKEYLSIIKAINDKKMFNEDVISLVGLDKINSWINNSTGIFSKNKCSFEVRFYEISIEGREVKEWIQPLFKSLEKSLFVLMIKRVENEIKVLVKLTSEIGVFDFVELGPSIQKDQCINNDKLILEMFEKRYDKKHTIVDTLLSEEGGRFYHEENQNIILELEDDDLLEVPKDYFWISLKTLGYFIMFNNYVNIQLRNLISII